MRAKEFMKSLDESPLPSDWDENVFKYDQEKMDDPDVPPHDSSEFDPIIQYVEKQQAAQLGRGSSRTVHNVTFDGKPTALKIAHNKSGLFQNMEEVKLLKNPEIQRLNITAPLIDYDKKNKYPVWLQTEQMRPCHMEYFKEVYGLGSWEIIDMIHQWGIDLAIEKVKEDPRITRNCTQHQQKLLTDLLHKYEVLMNHGVIIGDLSGGNWGIDNRGEPKIVDLGYSKNFTRAYNRGQYAEPTQVR